MRTGWKLSLWILVGLLCLGGLASADTPRQHKAKKTPLPPLPSGPQGPVQQVPLDSMPAIAPQVNYQDGQLTIVAPNSSLGDILRAVRKQTAAEMDIPSTATERVVTHLGPGPAREVMAELLNGSHFNYVLLGSPADPKTLIRVVLMAKSGPDVPGPNPAADTASAVNQPNNLAPPPQDAAVDAPEAEATEENAADDNADQNAAAEAEQQALPQEQPGVKTPQQLLQEMQQRQLQLQQQQPPGQPPVPGGGYPQPPQRVPPEQQQQWE